MIWLAWRRQRLAVLALGAYALVAIAVMVYYRVVTPAQLSGPDALACVDGDAPQCRLTGSDLELVSVLRRRAEAVRLGLIGFVTLAGVFLGAPSLAREWEQRTHLLVLSQSVDPRRWFAAKVAVVAVPAVVAAALLGATYVWWTSGLGDLIGADERFQAGRFEVQPLAMAGYAAFSVALGVAVGLVVRRAVPAMALTLVGWGGALYTVRWFVRPHYQPPVVVTGAGGDPTNGYHLDPTRWSLGQGYRDRSGGFVDGETARRALRECGDNAHDRFAQCLDGHDLVGKASLVQPGDRFWLFQGIEATLFAVLAAALVLGAGRWLRRRFAPAPAGPVRTGASVG